MIAWVFIVSCTVHQIDSNECHIVGESVEPEALNKKALDIVQRVRDKLTGKDFNTEVRYFLVKILFNKTLFRRALR